ncbi:MAG: HK97 family phage prohead protease [Dehalococcoidales bacterium]|nr:HK97 family phage prohead protease [Dehalococcoidales bacterium]
MPIPKPRSDEPEDEFISRCMGDEVMNEEYPDNEQRAAVCYSQWSNKAEVNMEKKTLQIQLKKDKPGSFTARIATLNVIDRDKDITLPGAFEQGKTVLISAYQHGSWMGALPVGKAAINEEGDEVIAEGEFNLDTAIGKEHYEAVKFSGDLQEWSYGFRPVEFEYGEVDKQEVRYLKKVDVFEISPVLKGAGIDTVTLGIKSDNAPYAEQAEAVLAAVSNLVGRTKSLADLRRKEGRDLSTTNKERINSLQKALREVEEGLKQAIESPEPYQEQALKEKIKFLKNEFEEVVNENN